MRLHKVLLVALLVLGFVACGEDDDPTIGEPLSSDSSTSTTTSTAGAPTTTTLDPGTVVEVRVSGGRPEGGIERAEIALGRRVTLRVVSDAPDEVHVHGYDLEVAVGPGEAGEIAFDATIPGFFEVELHDAGRQVVELRVNP
ncbi:MAG TPA: hypothetical protein VFV35_08055 [Acidimicrobiales bacterium]|nr:hypothetical protein [Acidimicrobiales bacterium]